jgi:predicted dehydrogenase
MIRMGVVGCGYWGSKHVRVLQGIAGVEETVLIDSNPARAEALGHRFSWLTTFPSLEEALPFVDALIIATPPRTHDALALMALRAGKDLLVEKPLATNVEAATRLIREAASSKRILMVGHTFLYNAAVAKLGELVRANMLGKIHYVDSARLNLGLYQNDVNVIWDLAPHDVSIINHILGSQPGIVQVWASRHASGGHEDVAVVRLEYPEVVAHLHLSWLDPRKVRRMTVVGSERMAVYNDMASEERIRIYDRGVVADVEQQDVIGVPMSYRYGDILSPFIEFQEPLVVQDTHFVDCVRSRTNPLTEGEDGLAVVRVLEACDVSLRLGRPVDLRDFPNGLPARPPGRLTMASR